MTAQERGWDSRNLSFAASNSVKMYKLSQVLSEVSGSPPRISRLLVLAIRLSRISILTLSLAALCKRKIQALIYALIYIIFTQVMFFQLNVFCSKTCYMYQLI